MCMITYVPAGRPIPTDGIENGGITNDDGHGWAVAHGSELVVGKSMDLYRAIDGFEAAREALGIGSVGLFHSRWGTAGEYGEYNIHPFYVGPGETTVMAHNGIFPNAFQPDDKDRRSDTRIFVDQIGWTVDNDKGIPSRRVSRDIRSVIGNGNKVLFLSVKSGKPQVRIIGAEQGVWDGGIWYSNSGYRRPFYSYRRSSSVGGWSSYTSQIPTIGGSSCGTGFRDERDELPWRCELCEAWAVDPETNYCDECGSCQDCYMSSLDCQCWLPSRRASRDHLTAGSEVERFDWDRYAQEIAEWRARA